MTPVPCWGVHRAAGVAFLIEPNGAQTALGVNPPCPFQVEAQPKDCPHAFGALHDVAPAKHWILAAADARKVKDRGRLAAQLRLLFCGGLRPSEMRGFPAKMMRVLPDGRIKLKVVQRAEYETGTIGAVKNDASKRTITLGGEASLVLKQYWVAMGQPRDGLLFPTRNKTAELGRNFNERVWAPLLAEAGYAVEKWTQRKRWIPPNKSQRGAGAKCRVEMAPFRLWSTDYTPHHGRHFAASALIASGALPKFVQRYLGHATLEITMNTYGHLFPDQQMDDQLADAIDVMVRARK